MISWEKTRLTLSKIFNFIYSLMEDFLPDTVVRVKRTGEFAVVIKRCFCGSGKSPIHYEVRMESGGISVKYHIDLEYECGPKIEIKPNP